MLGSIFPHVETPESRTLIYTSSDGVMELHENVTFEANTARYRGGAVSLPFESGSQLPAVVFCDRVCQDVMDLEADGQVPSARLMIELQSRGSLDDSAPFFSTCDARVPHSGCHHD